MAIKIEHDRPNCIGCLSPETLIVGPFGAKPISEIKVGDLVLTSGGTFQPVTGVMAHQHEGKIYQLTVPSMGSIFITEEHEVLIVRRKTARENNAAPFHFEWVPAAQLQSGDYVTYPKANAPFLANVGNASNSSKGPTLSLMKEKSIESQERVLLPIEIVEKSYSGTVHNLEIANNPDYCTSAGIVHNCAACAGVAPDHWEMNADGKSDVIGCTKRDDEWEEKDITDAEYDANLQAAQSCPVNVIHLVKKETGERII